MKRVGNIYEKLCSKENIRRAILLASKHKNNRLNVQKILNRREYYVEQISQMLRENRYTPSGYTMRIVNDGPSGKERQIHTPRFYPDQIVHWALMLQIQPLIMRGMYAHTCGSVPGRGQSHGKKYLRRWLDTDARGTKYCLKMDIRKFYHNVDHDVLKARFRRLIKDRDTLRLIDLIVDSIDSGLPIGNYTSQWFSNFFLQELDYLIKQRLHVGYYVRYVDDLVLLGPNKKKLHKARLAIAEYLRSVGLMLKGDWQVFPVRHRAIDFLGYRFYRSHTTLRSRNFLRIRRRIARVAKKPVIAVRDAAAIFSYFGMLLASDSRAFRQKYIDGILSIYELKEVIRHASRKQNATG